MIFSNFGKKKPNKITVNSGLSLLREEMRSQTGGNEVDFSVSPERKEFLKDKNCGVIPQDTYCEM
jgi:hypothetical protein